jgi:hypothetical protein
MAPPLARGRRAQQTERPGPSDFAAALSSGRGRRRAAARVRRRSRNFEDRTHRNRRSRSGFPGAGRGHGERGRKGAAEAGRPRRADLGGTSTADKKSRKRTQWAKRPRSNPNPPAVRRAPIHLEDQPVTKNRENEPNAGKPRPSTPNASAEPPALRGNHHAAQWVYTKMRKRTQRRVNLGH